MKTKLPNSEGFTLVELLVVISIISILATVLVTIINPIIQYQRGRDIKRKADLSQIQTSLERYRTDNDSYPVDTTNPYQFTANCPTSGTQTQFGTGGSSACSIIYLNSIPQDPNSAQSGVWNSGYYYYWSNGSQYVLAACLENANDSDNHDQSSIPAPGQAPSTSCQSVTGGKYYVLQNP